ncbi:MAG TPA: alpha/beta hydrolase [Vicinamibacterales bacterium]|nr:alpha/beta hydrolase [Vicinamibacterales bacterium]
MARSIVLALVSGALFLLPSSAALAQRPAEEAAGFAAYIATGTQVNPNITYLTASGVELKLDVYRPRGAAGPLPTAVLLHGGGYRIQSTKEAFALNVIPWLQMGWNAINVEYRSSGVALAPAAVEDVRCALRWVTQNAKQYNVDPNRIVITGASAGGHLASIGGMIPESAGLDRRCPGREPIKVAAIISWYGVFDYTTLVEDPTRDYAVSWIGPQPNRMEVARLVSPATYVRAGVPPTMHIHGDADPTVPYEQGVREIEALKKVGVPAELVTIPGGGHGNFPRDQVLRVWTAIEAFLAKNGLMKPAAAQTAQR